MCEGKVDLETLKGVCSEQEDKGRERLALGCPEKSDPVVSVQTLYGFYPNSYFCVTFSLSLSLTLLQNKYGSPQFRGTNTKKE